MVLSGPLPSPEAGEACPLSILLESCMQHHFTDRAITQEHDVPFRALVPFVHACLLGRHEIDVGPDTQLLLQLGSDTFAERVWEEEACTIVEHNSFEWLGSSVRLKPRP